MNEQVDINAGQNEKIKEVGYSYLKWFFCAAFLASLDSIVVIQMSTYFYQDWRSKFSKFLALFWRRL